MESERTDEKKEEDTGVKTSGLRLELLGFEEREREREMNENEKR